VLNYKGTKNGTIKLRDLHLHEPVAIYETQENGWMDKKVMLHWVDGTIHFTHPSWDHPHHPSGFIPMPHHGISCKRDPGPGMQVIHISAGCSGLVQPLDIGYNKLFKMHIHVCWEEFMIHNMSKNGSISTPLCMGLSAWASEAYWDPEKSPRYLKNLWLKTYYTWF
jgi:hypothetical protein